MLDNEIDELFFKYNLALITLQSKFDKLNTEYLQLGEDNPIEHIKYRIKSNDSIEKKLKKKNLEFNAYNIENNINDIVGVRIVCSFLSDLENLIEYITNDPDLKVLNTKDYIHNPKESGYSSYHIIVSFLVPINNHLEIAKAEIQLRTMAMDMWASLDHKIRYKKNVNLSLEEEYQLSTMREYVSLIDINLDKLNKEKYQNYIQSLNNNNLQFCSKQEINIFLYKYLIAINTIEKKLTLLKEIYIKNNKVNPIEHIKSRIKPIETMINKLEKKGKSLSLDNLEKYITDIGAIKIVCSFLSDAYEIIDIINSQKEFTIIDSQDYIANPKDNGYSSYHFVVLVPVIINKQINNVKVEIQVRTISMELWANLEHKLCYKKNVNDKTRLELKKIANVLQSIDPKMDDINNNIHKSEKTIK